MKSSFHNQHHRNSEPNLSTKKSRSENYFLGLAKYYRKKGLYKEALYTCDQALFHYGESSTARLIKAQCYFSLRQYAKSLSGLRKALEKEPKNLEALDLSMEIHKKLGQKKSISRIMERISKVRSKNISNSNKKDAVEEEPCEQEKDSPFEIDFVFATKTVAELYLRQGLKEKAKFVIEAMLKRDPNDAWTKEKLKTLKEETTGKRVLAAQADYLNRALTAIKDKRVFSTK